LQRGRETAALGNRGAAVADAEGAPRPARVRGDEWVDWALGRWRLWARVEVEVAGWARSTRQLGRGVEGEGMSGPTGVLGQMGEEKRRILAQGRRSFPFMNKGI